MKSRFFLKTSTLRWLTSEPADPFWNMALDEAVIREVLAFRSPPTIRFYQWDRPSVSIGYFQDPETALNPLKLAERKVPWVRRMTGGKAVYHFRELTYSLALPDHFSAGRIPPDLSGSCEKIGSAFAEALNRLGAPVRLYRNPRPTGAAGQDARKMDPLCFSIPSAGEALIEGKKVIGSAQKKFKGGFLQQGSILLNHRLEDFISLFQGKPDRKREFVGLFDFLGKEIGREALEASLVAGLERSIECGAFRGTVSEREIETARELAENKYREPGWNLKRLPHASAGGKKPPLLVAQRVDRPQVGRQIGRIKAKKNPDQSGETE